LRETETEALQRACRYSLIPNELGYCGSKNYSALFNSFISNPGGEKIPEVKSALRTFIGEHSYIRLIAGLNSLDEFSGEAIEAYWLGNGLTEKVPVEKIRGLFEREFSAMPKSIREKKLAALPERVFSHHSFHVLFVEFLTPAVPKIVENFDKCLVGWGSVQQVRGEKLKVKGMQLGVENGRLCIAERAKEVDNPFELDAKKGSLVTVHWENAIELIEGSAVKRLKKLTLANLELANAQR